MPLFRNKKSAGFEFEPKWLRVVGAMTMASMIDDCMITIVAMVRTMIVAFV